MNNTNWECTKGMWLPLGWMTGFLEFDTEVQLLCLLSDLGFELEFDFKNKVIQYTFYKGFS